MLPRRAESRGSGTRFWRDFELWLGRFRADWRLGKSADRRSTLPARGALHKQDLGFHSRPIQMPPPPPLRGFKTAGGALVLSRWLVRTIRLAARRVNRFVFQRRTFAAGFAATTCPALRTRTGEAAPNGQSSGTNFLVLYASQFVRFHRRCIRRNTRCTPASLRDFRRQWRLEERRQQRWPFRVS